MPRTFGQIQKTRQAAKAPPTTTQAKTIAELSDALGVPRLKVDTEAEARFLIDDLIRRERKQKRERSWRV